MKDNRVLILHRNSNEYFFPFCKEEWNIQSVFCNRYDSATFRLHQMIKANALATLVGWKKKISDYSKIIIFDYGWDSSITKFIKRHNSKCVIHLFFFNTISNEIHQMILKDKNIDKFWTFDQNDAEKYDINFNTPMYTKKMLNYGGKSGEKRSDVVFVGGAKNRESSINYVQTECKKRGLKTDFSVIKSPNDHITYSEYLRRISDANCILDITNEGQRGLTLRFMEALFLSKKLITNNADVKKYNFYNSKNIFILGEDDIENISEFVSSPYVMPSQKVINYYDMESWIDRFQ